MRARVAGAVMNGIERSVVLSVNGDSRRSEFFMIKDSLAREAASGSVRRARWLPEENAVGVRALFLIAGLVAATLRGPAIAGQVGERHLLAANPTAAPRDAEHRGTVRVTVWYPAAPDAKEASLDIGPPARPLFRVGSAAPDAAFADDRRRPVILFSHGFGGTARMMAWFMLPLARAGYVVIAVEHPGNNATDKMTIGGSAMLWDRPGDLAAALGAARADPAIGPHLDLGRLGVAGFSAGGFTALVAAGARVDMARLQAFCDANAADGVCRPQREFPLSTPQMLAGLKSPELAP